MFDEFKGRYDERMVGKNGGDAISRTSLIAAIVLVALSFVCIGVNPFLYVLVLVVGIALAVYAALRMNSRDLEARAAENEAFLAFFQSLGRKVAQPRGESGRGSRAGATRERRGAGRPASGDRRPRPAESRGRTPRPVDEEPPAAPHEEAPHARRETAAQARPEAAQPEKVTVACDNCGQKLRVPAGKGTIKVRCPKCENVFTMTT